METDTGIGAGSVGRPAVAGQAPAIEDEKAGEAGPTAGALQIAGTYALFGLLWILLSDRAASALAGNSLAMHAQVQAWKGGLFVLATAGLVFVLTRHALAVRIDGERRLRRLHAELEQRVEERTAELAACNRELETFSYAVSHDLKAPLRVLDGYCAILEEEAGPLLSGDASNSLTQIRKAARQMHDLIGDILAYSRAERQSTEVQEMDLAVAVEAILEELAEGLEKGGVALRSDVGMLRLRTSPDGLAMVLRNLIGNAIKFCSRANSPLVEVGAGLDGDRVRLWVRDNGIGFDMKHHERIFEIFQRLERADEYPGTGVGLALVRKAVTRMGGRVWAEGSPGAGATFHVELPAAAASTPPRTRPRVPS